MFKYEIGQEPSPGFVITDRFLSPYSQSPMYIVNNYDTPFFEEEVEHLEYWLEWA